MSPGAGARIAGGAGFGGDRIEPAADLVARGDLDYVVLECLAERTIALGQQRRLADPSAGYEPSLERRMRAVLPALVAGRTRLVSNIGAANPEAAGALIRRLAAELGCAVEVAVVTGDDVLDRIDVSAPAWEDGRPLEDHGELVSANAYLGADALMPALASSAQVIVCGRVADPSLFVAPLAHTLGWDLADPRAVAAGTTVGHLLECGAQVTGGYFADAGAKTVPDLAHVGFPIAEVAPDGSAVIAKLDGTGGRVDRLTVAEQLTYEISDPAAYVTPDVVADFTTVRLEPLGADRVRVSGATGGGRPERLKVSVGYRAGFRCEAEISYAGAQASARAAMAREILVERLDGSVPRLRAECLGLVSLDAPAGSAPGEWMLRVSGRAPTRSAAERIGEEVTALYTNGPAGGGGARASTSEVIGVLSTSIAREQVVARTSLVGSP